MAIPLLYNESHVFINVPLYEFCALQNTTMHLTYFFVFIVDECFSTTSALSSQPTLVMRIEIVNPSLYFQVLLTTLDDFFSTINLYHGVL